MGNRFQDFRRKEVININDGVRLGFVADVDIKVPEGQVAAIIVYGPARFFGLFGRGEEYCFGTETPPVLTEESGQI